VSVRAFLCRPSASRRRGAPILALTHLSGTAITDKDELEGGDLLPFRHVAIAGAVIVWVSLCRSLIVVLASAGDLSLWEGALRSIRGWVDVLVMWSYLFGVKLLHRARRQPSTCRQAFVAACFTLRSRQWAFNIHFNHSLEQRTELVLSVTGHSKSAGTAEEMWHAAYKP